MSDLNNDFNTAKNKIKALKSYLEISAAAKALTKSGGNSLSQSNNELLSSLENITKDQKRYTRNQPTSSDRLLELINLVNGSGLSTTKYLKRKLLGVVVKIEPEVREIIIKGAIKALGCSQEQTFTGFDENKLTSRIDQLPLRPQSQGIYVPLQSLDLASLLKTPVDSKLGQISFEKKEPSVAPGVFKPYAGPQPFPMNKELNLRLNTSRSFFQDNGKFYQGTSGLPLFDFVYSQTNQYGVNQDCYRVALINKPTPNKVGDFLNDYYSTIKLVDSVDITELLVEIITGSISIQGNQSAGQIGENSKFTLLLQRILGLCFDSRREIDVSGVSKVAELDGVDDSFFELTEVDLRNIDIRISNIQNGIVQFEDCDNVNLPVDYQTLINELIKFRDVLDDQTTEEQVDTISNIIDTIYQNPDWGDLLPTNFNLDLAVNKDFLKQIPLAVVSAVLSPKVLFPILILLQVVESKANNNYNQNITSANTIIQSGNTVLGDVDNTINNSTDFLKVFKTFNIDVVSRIGAIFLIALYEELKKDILNLIASIIYDVGLRKKLKKYRIIIRLIGLLSFTSQLLNNSQQCKSLITDVLNILKLIFGQSSGSTPLPLLFLSQFLPGYAPERATINTIELLQSVGIPTGPLPDGSPNLMGIYNLMSNIGVDNEESDNGKTEGTVITPLGIYPVYSKEA